MYFFDMLSAMRAHSEAYGKLVNEGGYYHWQERNGALINALADAAIVGIYAALGASAHANAARVQAQTNTRTSALEKDIRHGEIAQANRARANMDFEYIAKNTGLQESLKALDGLGQ